MIALSWNSQFESGIQPIDKQHKELFEKLNIFYHKATSKAHWEDALLMLEFLSGYVLEHFQMEEAFMHNSGYPMLPAHRAMHESMIFAVKRYITLVAAERDDKSKILQEVAEFTGNWLRQHVAQEDAQFFQFYNRQPCVIDSKYIGGRCELMSLENKLLGFGTIAAAQDDTMHLTGEQGLLPRLQQGAYVKLSLVNAPEDFRAWIGRVASSQGEALQLDSLYALTEHDRRAFFRLKTSIPATLHQAGQHPAQVTVENLSLNGLLFSGTQPCSLCEHIELEFILLEAPISLACTVCREIAAPGQPYQYGCRFETFDKAKEDLLFKFFVKHQKEHLGDYRR